MSKKRSGSPLPQEPVMTRGRVDSDVGMEDTADTKSYANTASTTTTATFSKPSTPQLIRLSSSSSVHIQPQATSSENPQPQIAQAPNPTESGTNGDKLVVVMVGLPARGKTYIARKIAHYFRFFHGAPAEV
jgi:hypothetical protein